MEYNIKDKIEWMTIFLYEFGKQNGLTLKQAYNYLARHKGLDFVDRHYDYLHTQSFTSAVEDTKEYCFNQGGGLR